VGLALILQVLGLSKIPIVKQGDSVADQIVEAAREEGVRIENRDIIVIAQKIVSKAEGHLVSLNSVKPSAQAEKLAKTTGKDPRHVEVILKETARVVRNSGPHLIMETHHGFVCANAGVDKSNVPESDALITLPADPDKSAETIRNRIMELTGAQVGVIISDTFGRAWRIGQVNVAIGVAGVQPIIDYRGSKDMFGYVLNVTQMAVADELASAAELVMRKSTGIPVVIIRGFECILGSGSGKELLRPREEDLFR
jgi:coenzyme F420-0:L-glutamate ligase/coenzyme F420-1:gamma-L-glutamate ligase